MSKNILILQHINIETPGYILDLMQRDKFNLTTIELDEGETIPNDIDQFDGMFCMGGPMDTWMEKQYPWLIDEKKKIKETFKPNPTSKYGKTKLAAENYFRKKWIRVRLQICRLAWYPNRMLIQGYHSYR